MKEDNHPVLIHERSFGQKAADFITSRIGSWAFITIFIVFLFIWVGVNTYFLVRYQMGKPWDPYPFILLNLMLSCVAAIEAPVILMSQNREEQKDRIRAKYDYDVNKKAEKEIREVKAQLDRIERLIGKR